MLKDVDLRRVLAQTRKELLQVRRDPIGLALVIVLPLVMMTLLGTALSLHVTGVAVVVQDLDQTPTSLRFGDAFRASLTFKVVSWPVERNPEGALRSGHARGAVIIPGHFERDLMRGADAHVQMLIDATDANTANVLRGTVAALARDFSARLRARGRPVVQPVTMDARLWYNPGLRNADYIGPGALVVALALLPPLLASLAMSRERESGTILQVYVSGVRASEFLLGKVIAYCCVAAFDWLLGLLICHGVFGLRLTGNPSAFVVGSLCFLATSISFGTMVGARMATQATTIQAMQLGGFVLTFLLSGFIFPVRNIPLALRWLSAITPARYYLEIVRDAFLRGGGWPTVWWCVLALTMIGSVFFTLAWLRMRRMQLVP
jgi:ABC-2 type transport system permease protein